MNRFLKFSLVVALLTLPGVASATVLADVTGDANCDGFSVEYCVRWASALTAEVCYTAVLTDEGGNEVATFQDCETLNRPGPWGGPSDPITVECGYLYMGSWNAGELCGNYTATVTVSMTAASSATPGLIERSSDSFEASFLCDCPVEVCNYTPGFWKNHEEDWPVMELCVGGVTYGQEALLEIMDTPVRGDATIILAYHLIAAKLNVLSGSDPSINGAIADADALLMANPIGSMPEGDARDMILDVKNMLAAYNELGCGEDEEPCLDKALPNETSSSWSELKANFR
jgi:hypothetical protein